MTHAQVQYRDRDFMHIRGRPIRHQVLARDWVCGICESKLVARAYVHADRAQCQWRTVCARDEDHSPDSFIHGATLERRVHREMTFAGNLALAERRNQMGLKDRDTVFGVPRRMRLGRIGRIRQGIVATNAKGKKYPKAVGWFIVDPTVEDGAERDEMLADVRAAIEANAPGQNLDQPTVLPIVFLANVDDIIAPESYKVRKGRAGTVWCAGDGEVINWKLTDDFRVEIAGGAHVETGEVVPCPGGCSAGRHEWCADCTAELELNFAISGYERTGVWMLRTQSMTFRDQFWTQIGLVRAMAERGIIPGLVGVPFLLRRQKESVLAPSGNNGSLISVEMPLTTIEIHPLWLQQVMRGNPRLMARTTTPPPALPSGAPAGPDWDGYSDAGDDPDVIYAGPASGASEPEPPTPDTQVNGNGSTNGHRPYTATQVRHTVRTLSKWQKGAEPDFADAQRMVDGEPITEKQMTAVARLLSKAVVRNGMKQDEIDKTRHDVMDFLVGVRSTKSLTKLEASALIKWLAAAESNLGDVNVYARSEVVSILAAAGIEVGQAALPL